MSEQENTPVLYEIPQSAMDKVRTRLKKLNKRAEKLGAPKVELIVHKETEKPDSKWVDRRVKQMIDTGEVQSPTAEFVDLIRRQAPIIKYFHTELKGEAPKLAGWTFIGTLDHYSLPGKVIVNTVPGEEVPAKFYDYAPVCDHCQKERVRKETFVVEHENGEQKAVGRQCIRDFLGHDPKSVIGFLRSINSLMDDLRDDDYLFGGGGIRVPDYFPLEAVLVSSVAAIETYGWVSRQIARDRDERATADIVSYALQPPAKGKEYETWKRAMREMKLFGPDAKEKSVERVKEAQAAIEWVKEQEARNEYMHNLKMIVDSEIVSYKLVGYAASIISAYQRAMERLRIKKLTFKKSEYVGEKGKRQEFEVKLISKKYLDSYYGVVQLHSFVDNEGRTLVWFANTEDSGMSVDGSYRIKGTVKKHEEYNGWKQTMLNRVNMLEELEEKEQ